MFGQAKYGGEFKKRTFAKLKDGEAMYRIIPPLPAANGVWSAYWEVHYGYTNSAGKLRTFASPLVRNRANRMIEVPDAALERIEKLKSQLEQAKSSGNKELADKLTPLVAGAKPKFNMDKNHFMNAIDASGNVVVLQLRHSAKKMLDIEINSLRDKGIDPLGEDTGRYFVFRRTGMGLDTSFKVSVAQETVNVPGFGEAKRDLVHVLTGEVAQRALSESQDLKKLFKKPSSEEVARIVAEGPTAVDEILDAKGGADEPSDSVVAPAQATPAPASAPIAPPPVPEQPAPPVQAPVPPPQAPAPTPAAEAHVAAMSDAEFLKSMGL